MIRRLSSLALAALVMTACAPPTPTGAPHTYAVAIWAPYHGAAERATLQAQQGLIAEVNFFWYELSAAGEIVALARAEDADVLAEVRASGMRIVPTIMNSFDRERVRAVISDPQRRAQHIQALVDLALLHTYDGLDVDYENLEAEDRAAFTTFIEELAQALHAQGLRLSIAVHPKTEDAATWGGPAAQDWPRLGAVVDEFKIMTYDYHWSSGEPGAIAPIEWADAVLSYAATCVPPEKTYLGMHFYGYNWGGGEQAQSLTWQKAEALRSAQDAAVQRDPSGEAWFTYEEADVTHTIYYADAFSVQAKLAAILKRHPQIAGVAIWRLGDEDPQNWEAIRAALKP